MGDLSAHFSTSEFGGKPNPDLVRRLEALRKVIGNRPLTIVSGIRSKAHNAAVGGARNSQHLLGNAADIPAGLVTRRQAEKVGFTGIGVNWDGKSVVHVDVRSGPRVVWQYRRDGTWFVIS